MKLDKNTVLIIDGDKMNIFALTHFLSTDFNVLSESTAERGIAAAQAARPNVILMSLVLPDMDGFQILSILKSTPTVKNIPVIFITEQGSVHDEEQGLILGAVDYISKPFSSVIVKMRIQNQLSLVMHEQRIQELTTSDAITGLVSRGYFDSILANEWHRAARSKYAVSFAIFNIDHFEVYNTKYGTQKGDEALKFLGQAIANRLTRPGDQAARWGGDEIALVLSDTPLAGVIKVANDICQSIESESLALDGSLLTGLTISAGVHSFSPKLNSNFELDNSYIVSDFVMDTIIALERAKKAGRNRALAFSNTTTEEDN